MLASDPHISYVTGSNINLGRGSDHRTVKVGSDFTYHNRKLKSRIIFLYAGFFLNPSSAVSLKLEFKG